MDYGYQLLRHAVQQVFGNLGQAAWLTLPLTLIPALFFLFTNPVLLMADPTTQAPVDPGGINWGMFVLGLALSVIAWCWAAVAWHRFVLLEEYARGPLPAWRGDRVMSYLGRALLVGLIVGGAAMLMGIGIGVVLVALPSQAVAVVLTFALVFGLSWVATRIGLILPAAAIGEPLKVGESWNATAPVSGQIILPIFVIAVVSGIASQLVLVLLGPSIPGALVSVFVSWLQLLVNLALLTTLYGNLIEGRALN